MAIPIRNYIEIATKVVASSTGERDFSGMVFTADSMGATYDGDVYASIRTDYAAGKPVALTKDAVIACFAETTMIYTFASKYFSYSGGTRVPQILNVCKVLGSETALSAFNRCVGETVNFGAFTFLGDYSLGAVGDGGLLDVATANEDMDAMLQMVVVATATQAAAYAAALDGLQLTHLVINTVDDVASDEDDTNYGAYPAVAWYAGVNYNATNAAGTIDYKQFGGLEAEVTDEATKLAYDAINANYIGQVKTYGNSYSFYQTGVNMNGTDMGTIRDAAWIKGVIESGYFALQLSVQKIPANDTGAAMVRNLVLEAVNRGIDNGVILIDKPLTDTQIQTINQYAGTDSASDSVQNSGYYIDTKIVNVDDKYHVQYTLIYAKGDHITKVDGTHVIA